jgi:predicted PurR-regulated permease PerM
MGSSIQTLIGKAFTAVLNHLSDILVNLPNLLLQLAVFIFTFYFAVRDSGKLKGYFSKLSPFSASTEQKLMSEFRGITNSIVYGHVLIGILQGLLVGVGLFILGVPKALILTSVAVIASIIPVLGSWIVWLPISIFLIASGQTSSGLFLFLYGLLFVSTIDNILRPLFISKNSNLNVALSVIGTIGGLYFFGIIGLVLGPLILAYILIIFDFYREGKLSELFKK